MSSVVSRRRFLQGCGVTLSLPWMASLAPKVARAGETGKPPVRSAFIYFPNGVWEKDWIPETTGSDYKLTPSLEPLGDLKSEVLVLTGLDKKNSHGGDGHYAKTANFLTGMPVTKTTGKDISSGGISVDQLMAQHVGGNTPLPSLELGTEPVISGIDSNVGYTRLYGSHISWQSPTRPVAKEINPRLVYERLFGKALSSASEKAESYQNLLDFVLEDARRLRPRLGRDDQFKMDEYLDSVRAVEKRIEFATKGDRDWQPEIDEHALAMAKPGVPAEFRDHIGIMLDLIVLGFQTDSTRVASLMFANDVSGRNFSFLDGVKGGHHEMSHHENKKEKIEQYQRINRWHVEQFATMLGKLQAIQEGDGTLLDNCMILFGSSMSDGNRHDPDNLPILLGGRGGRTLNSGRHLAADGQVPLCNLYLAMLDRMGVAVEAFGDSTGPLKDLA
ncbi:DUF1552 domain-containing protein [Bremerella cremea]|uniref:DUF1552 domain-containing protein n=1 Tax=Blastopirellula marina TaxID=124 RepID=A0A2S8G8N6_9BACT|nr:DUF1552 domain-containing protein [Blastopirellula marina]PQO40641.1 hypothetical protein C5Y83_00720 [Blastopirellula marina]RCS52223.1 DUF1552 domain-containing protein [Bremerella cremea]